MCAVEHIQRRLRLRSLVKYPPIDPLKAYIKKQNVRIAYFYI